MRIIGECKYLSGPIFAQFTLQKPVKRDNLLAEEKRRQNVMTSDSRTDPAAGLKASPVRVNILASVSFRSKEKPMRTRNYPN